MGRSIMDQGPGCVNATPPRCRGRRANGSTPSAGSCDRAPIRAGRCGPHAKRRSLEASGAAGQPPAGRGLQPLVTARGAGAAPTVNGGRAQAARGRPAATHRPGSPRAGPVPRSALAPRRGRRSPVRRWRDPGTPGDPHRGPPVRRACRRRGGRAGRDRGSRHRLHGRRSEPRQARFPQQVWSGCAMHPVETTRPLQEGPRKVPPHPRRHRHDWSG